MSSEIQDTILKRLDDLERRMVALETKNPKQDAPGVKRMSAKEFLLLKTPVDDVQKTLVLGYYLEHEGGMDRFTIRDIAEGFRLAREPVPENINDKVNKNIEKGHMMQTREKKDKLKAWQLTNSGERTVESGPQREAP